MQTSVYCIIIYIDAMQYLKQRRKSKATQCKSHNIATYYYSFTTEDNLNINFI